MLQRHKLRQQAARRGSGPEHWKLYETEKGNVPKGLGEMFSGINRAKQVIARPKKPVLTAAENAVLDRTLKFIERHGINRLQKVTPQRGLVSPHIQRIRTARGPLMELKIRSTAHNPRFIYVVCQSTAVFLDAFKKKAQKLARKEIRRSSDRYIDLKQRGEC